MPQPSTLATAPMAPALLRLHGDDDAVARSPLEPGEAPGPGLITACRHDVIAHCEPISEKPSPGGMEGGITTIEEKSLGAEQESGTVPVARMTERIAGIASAASTAAERGGERHIAIWKRGVTL